MTEIKISQTDVRISFVENERTVEALVKHIYLMRHAKPELPCGGRIYYGQSNYPLSAEGIETAERVAAYLKQTMTFDYLYASDMTRAQQTADIVTPYLSAEIKPELREVNLGEWEGRTYDEVRKEYIEIYEKRGTNFADVAPPGGETLRELQKRALPVFNEIVDAHEVGNVLIVAHGAVIWSVMSSIFKVDLNDMYFYPQDFCGIHALEAADGRLRLVRYNWLPTLGA